MGEGGAVFVLEPARPPGAARPAVYAEVAGYGAGSDAYQHGHPQPRSGAGHRPPCARRWPTPRSTRQDIDYINAHATSTPVGDIAEARVLTAVFGEPIQPLPVSSTKSMTGHLLTAAAAVEALACLVGHGTRTPAADDQSATIPIPSAICATSPTRPGRQPVRVAVSNSFGFGGSNTCLVLKAV